jgi:hypothetical protein
MQAKARMASVVSSTLPASCRFNRSVRPHSAGSVMNTKNHLSIGSRSRAVSVLMSLLSFVGVGIGGLWLHIVVLPLPIETTPGLIARFAYFLLWLGGLIHFLGRAILGSSSQLWHSFIYFLLGTFLGYRRWLFRGYSRLLGRWPYRCPAWSMHFFRPSPTPTMTPTMHSVTVKLGGVEC